MSALQISKFGWPLLLCAASVAITLACVKLSGGMAAKSLPENKGDKPMGEKSILVKHVSFKTEKPYAEVIAAFDSRVGKFDQQVYESLRTGGDPDAVRAKVEAMAGSSGFMNFRTSDHGANLRLVGQHRNALQYLIGNPLIAVEMTRHNIGAALYAPLRVLIYEPEGGGACIEYDLPSSQFGQFGDDRVDRVAASLDRKLSDLVSAATR